MEKYYIFSTKYSIKERQTKKHGKVYDCVFRICTMDGRIMQKKLCGFPTKTALREAYTEFVTKHCELVRNNPTQRQTAATAQSTALFGDLYAEYLIAQSGQVKESSLYEMRHVYELFFKETIGDLPMASVTKTMLIDWQEKLWARRNPKTGTTYSAKYNQKIRGFLYTFLSWCEYKHEIPNQMRNVKCPKRRAQAAEMEFWKTDEFAHFLSVVENPQHQALFATLFYTGRRKGEVLALATADVQKERIRFNKTYTRKTVDGTPYKITTTKNEKRAYTIICKPLQRILAEYKPQSPFFFGGANPVSETTLTRIFNAYVAKAGVKKIRIHDLRHSFVALCIHLGANIYTVANLIGDTPEQVLKTYGHLYVEDVAAIIGKITE